MIHLKNPMSWRRWCPKGCGKCVEYIGMNEGYSCLRCGAAWNNKQELLLEEELQAV